MTAMEATSTPLDRHIQVRETNTSVASMQMANIEFQYGKGRLKVILCADLIVRVQNKVPIIAFSTLFLAASYGN